MASLAGTLAKEHEVTVVSATFEGVEGPDVRHRKVTVLGAEGPLLEMTFFLASTLKWWTNRLRGRRDFDMVHSHDRLPLFADVISSHYCEREARDRASRHPADMAATSLLQRVRSRVMGRAERALFGRATTTPLIVLSERMGKDFGRHYGMPSSAITVVYSGVDSMKYGPSGPKCL